MITKTLLILSALAFGVAQFASADQAMPGMDMGGMKTAQKPTPVPLSVTATINPAAPRTGDNTVDLLVTDAAGKPITGLKLTASVAMTSMDMGTSHPAFTEKGNGHYTAKVTFGMDGPWRVVIRSQGTKVAVLDFEAGAKTPWKFPQGKAASGSSSAPVAPTAKETLASDKSSGMDMGGSATASASANTAKPDAPANREKASGNGGMNSMPGMDMGGKKADASDGMAGMDMGGTGESAMSGMKTGIADMKTATIPRLQEKGTYTATGDENWKAQTGFGHNAPMVGMMNQMMVGGTGMEGMKMPAMNMKFDEQNYAKPTADDANSGMASMDMGNGKSDAMPGMNMDAAPSPATANAPASSSSVKITAPPRWPLPQRPATTR